MPELCALCRKPFTDKNPRDRHHVRGRRAGADNTGLVMRVHHFACHPFADFVTQHYTRMGKLEQLYPNRVIYLYNRVIGLRDGDKRIFWDMA